MRITNILRSAALLTGVGIGILSLSGQAHAGAFVLSPTPSPGDTLDFKFGGYTAENPGVTTGNSGGKETTWGVGYVTELDNFSNGNTRIWDGNGANPQNTSVEFIMYGIADQSFAPGSPGTLKNVGCTVGAGCDGKIHIDFYTLDGTDPVRTGAITPGSRTGFNSVTGISDVGQALMSWVLVPGDLNNTGDNTTSLYQFVNSSVLPTTGSGNFLADCVSGPACSLFGNNTEQLNGLTNLFGDFRSAFTLQSCAPSTGHPCPGGLFPNGFAGFINDPAVTTAAVPTNVPEPTSLALIGVGLLLLGGFAARKKA